MPRRAKGPRLWLQPARHDSEGKLLERAVWCIRDGSIKRSTGCPESQLEAATEKLHEYLALRYAAPRERDRHPTQIRVADVLNIYVTDRVPKLADPLEAARRIGVLEQFFGGDRLSDINGKRCRAYVEFRGVVPAARRELEDLRAAINYHRREGLCSEVVSVSLPERSPSRERWLTRAEAARLIWAAWRYKEKQNLRANDRHTRRHVARFILTALYTGTRSSAICAAALEPTPGTGWIDLEQGVFYRRAPGARETKKRQPAIRLPRRLLTHMRRWKAKGQTYVVEWNGEPVRSVKKAFRATAKDQGLDGVTPHVLRHTAATWLMQAGAPIHEVCGFLGMTRETLERVYGHHHPDYQKGAVGAFDQPRQKPDSFTRTETDSFVSNETKIVGFATK